MHIPDGYLSPATCGTMYAVSVPFWYLAVNRVRKVLTHRTVPVLALFAAFAFVLMMFNVPLPGGTTGHAVGGTLLAIVLGPWAAVLGISVVLGIQALFFGDGGLMTFGANCFNMAIVLPFVGYFIYKIISANSEATSPRRLMGAVVGSYLGIVVASLVAGIEFGIQPAFSTPLDGTPLYAPYSLNVALPGHAHRTSGGCRTGGSNRHRRYLCLSAAHSFQPDQSRCSGQERGQNLAAVGRPGSGGPGDSDRSPGIRHCLGRMGRQRTERSGPQFYSPGNREIYRLVAGPLAGLRFLQNGSGDRLYPFGLYRHCPDSRPALGAGPLAQPPEFSQTGS